MVAEMVTPRPSVAMRWSILFAASGMLWGFYFIYDIPASLSTPLQKHLGLSDAQNAYLVAALYTAYSVPNFILPCISGFAAQRYGEKRILVLSIGVAVLGQLIFAASLAGKMRSLMVSGRVLIGIGSETLAVIAQSIVTRWFHDNTLALSLAILLCISRLGSVATSVITPRLTESYGVSAATWVSTIIALSVALTCATYLVLMDHSTSEEEDSVPNYKNSFSRLPRVFWLLAIICVTSYGCLGPFNNSAQRFLSSRFYNGDEAAAGVAVSIPNTLSGILVLPFGILLELPRFKNYPLAILLSGGLLLIAHLWFLLQFSEPLIPLVLLGVGYASFGVAFWPTVASSILGDPVTELDSRTSLLEPSRLSQESATLELGGALEDLEENIVDLSKRENEDLVVIGYGIMTSFLNLSIGLVPIVLAWMEILAGYSGLEMVFVSLATISIFASAKLMTMDREVDR